VGAAIVCRALVCWSVRLRFGTSAVDLLLLPLRDVLSFAVHVASLSGRTVVWRGQRYGLDTAGRLTCLPE
jgi:hypothetical protein